MPSYSLSFKADNDLDDIADYTLRVWGVNQTRDYVTRLLQCFQYLADNPNLGRSAVEYAPGLKKFNYEAHTIFYEKFIATKIHCPAL
jgi:toxin ParE1/3/4